MTIPAQDCPHYDNDEVMAKLGRELIDMYIGQRQSGRSMETIGRSLINNLDQYIEEIDDEDEELERQHAKDDNEDQT